MRAEWWSHLPGWPGKFCRNCKCKHAASKLHLSTRIPPQHATEAFSIFAGIFYHEHIVHPSWLSSNILLYFTWKKHWSANFLSKYFFYFLWFFTCSCLSSIYDPLSLSLSVCLHLSLFQSYTILLYFPCILNPSSDAFS